MDGTYQSVRLATFDVGWRNLAFVVGFPDLGPAVTYHPRLSGEGLAGSLGYLFPYGAFPAALGANARIELAFSYIHASVTDTRTSGPYSVASALGVSWGLNSMDKV